MSYSSKEALDDLTYDIIGAAIHVHKSLGPGLLESIYQQCLAIELTDWGILFANEFIVPVLFNHKELETSLRCDLFIEESIVVELKSVKEFAPIHEAQLMTYMKLLKAPKGILINFNCSHLFKEGQKTYVNEYFERLPDREADV